MDESNSQPTRCPCGFFGSPQTLGLCSKCFREREQSRNQGTTDVSRQSVTNDLARQVIASSANSSDGPRQSNGGNLTEVQTKKSDQSRSLSTSTTTDQSVSVFCCQSTSQLIQSGANSVADRTLQDVSLVNKTSSASANDLTSTGPTCSCANDAAERRLALKRKHSDVSEDTPADGTPIKRRRPANPNSYCHKCSCRLELAVQAMGKCKCGCVFCQLHRLPEQHDCSYDHKEDGRREARAKMVPARKHVGTTLKRLDSDS